MPGARSRQGCDECRRRRRKCDEQKPRCGQCLAFHRLCEFPLRLVFQHARKPSGPVSEAPLKHHETPPQNPQWLPQSLPNGVPLSPRYQRLLGHFSHDILASLSCHPSIHKDLGQGLVPAALESPQLMSACLALSAAGFLSRGVLELDGVEMAKILNHLQSSGLSLLRTALATAAAPAATGRGEKLMSETLLATCLIWCLTDVFTYRRFDTTSSSWRIHLQGIRAILDRDRAQRRDFIANTGTSTQVAMKHLHQLYLSLQTLPHITSTAHEAAGVSTLAIMPQKKQETAPTIDGFLGYSDELLDVMQQIDRLSRNSSVSETDILLGKVHGMIARDSVTAPPVAISPSPPTPQQNRDFTLCHQVFQHATLVQLYRRLYHLPSRALEIQAAVKTMQGMLESLHTTGSAASQVPSVTSGESMWVAMAMPVFTLGCEAYTRDQQAFVLDKMDRLEACIRSLHVKIIRQALTDVWALRKDTGDVSGDICAATLLEKLDYDIILF